MTIEILQVDSGHGGGLRLALKVTTASGNTYETQMRVSKEDASTMTTTGELQAWVSSQFPATPAWATAAVGTAVS